MLGNTSNMFFSVPCKVRYLCFYFPPLPRPKCQLPTLCVFFTNALEHHPHRCSVCDPAYIFLTSKFSYLLFCNPTHKTENGTAIWWELLIANHLDQSLWLANQKQGSPVKSYLLHSSVAGAQWALDCYKYQQIDQMCRTKKPFSWAKLANVHFSSSNFNVQCHILSTDGDALTLQ
jgi:hypothetical protein